eukprot:1147543-Pelagomonas_calceolata.AAC.6
MASSKHVNLTLEARLEQPPAASKWLTDPQKPSQARRRKASLGPSSKAVTSGTDVQPNWEEKSSGHVCVSVQTEG